MSIEIRCLQCGKIFKVKPERASAKWCCKACHNAYRAKQSEESVGKDYVLRKCKICNKEFKVYKVKSGKAIYFPSKQTCSKECLSKALDTSKSTEELKNNWLNKAIKKFGNGFDYSEVVYKDFLTPVEIICNKHRCKFVSTPVNHLNSIAGGCPECIHENRLELGKKNIKSKQYYINLAKEVHGDKYDYSDFEYVSANKKGKIYCKKHKTYFEMSFITHVLSKQGCPTCAAERRKVSCLLAQDEFIKRAVALHGDAYDYSLVEYKGMHKHVTLKCNTCGKTFKQNPQSHLNGHGCSSCIASRGEKAVEKWLKDHNINYETQKRFKNCKNKKPLPFDFYLPKYNICIEFQGEQHYIESFRIDMKDPAKRLKEQQKRDQIKRDFCKDNKIKLLEIRGWNKVFDFLDRELLPLVK